MSGHVCLVMCVWSCMSGHVCLVMCVLSRFLTCYGIRLSSSLTPQLQSLNVCSLESGDEGGDGDADCGANEVLVLSLCSLLMKYGASPGMSRHSAAQLLSFISYVTCECSRKLTGKEED